LEGPVPMVRPGPRMNIAGIPKIFLSWTKQRSGGPEGNVFHREDRPHLRNPVPELSELGRSTRIFPTERERERERES
jgi:hypothetical protein